MTAFPADAAERLRGLGCAGVFEAHLTVGAADDAARERFRLLCERLGVKCVLIELARGASRSQPMTASVHRGDAAAAMAEVEALYAALGAAGFAVTRVKLEADARNAGVPEADADAVDGTYFEFHAKVRLPLGADLAPLAGVCAEHGAHLSRNSRAVARHDGTEHRFVTLRVAGRGAGRGRRPLRSAAGRPGHGRLYRRLPAARVVRLRRQARPGRRLAGRAVSGRTAALFGVLREVAALPECGGMVLRGGLLTRDWVAPAPRPARDIDFVGDFPFGVAETRALFAGDAAAEGIWLDSAFPGVRLTLTRGGHLVTIDVGFNDPLVPPAEWHELRGPDGPVRLRVVRPETQVSWKLHGLAEMAADWRPKDLADVWLIARAVSLDAGAMPEALRAAFESRGMTLGRAARLFDAPHWGTKGARVRWEACQRDFPELAAVRDDVRARLAGWLDDAGG